VIHPLFRPLSLLNLERTTMNVPRPERPPHDAQASAAEAHGGIRGKEVTFFRRQPESSGEVIASDAHSLVERVSTTSTNEIDKLIGQLRTLREFFQNEGQRIQREIDEYARLGDAVLKSTKTMVTNMAQLKYTGEIAQDKAE
jgi:hypothetical protein